MQGGTGERRPEAACCTAMRYISSAWQNTSGELGYSALEYEGDAPGYIEYLRKVGFVPEQGVHRKVL